MRNKTYVGHVKNDIRKMERFRSAMTPTFESHGEKYDAVVGPFRTVKAARVFAKYGYANPHMTCVADVERLVLAGRFPNE